MARQPFGQQQVMGNGMPVASWNGQAYSNTPGVAWNRVGGPPTAIPMPWNEEQSYVPGQLVTSGGQTYRALTDVQRSTPDINPAFKELVYTGNSGDTWAKALRDMQDPSAQQVRLGFLLNNIIPRDWSPKRDTPSGDAVSYGFKTYIAIRSSAAAEPKYNPAFVDIRAPSQVSQGLAPSEWTGTDGIARTQPIRQRVMDALARTYYDLQAAKQVAMDPSQYPDRTAAMKRLNPGWGNPAVRQRYVQLADLEMAEISRSWYSQGSNFLYFYDPDDPTYGYERSNNGFYALNTATVANGYSDQRLDQLVLHEISHKAGDTNDNYYHYDNGSAHQIYTTVRPDRVTGSPYDNNADTFAVGTQVLSGRRQLL